MSVIRKVLTAIAIAAVIYFAPQIVALLGVTGFMAAVIGAVIILAGTAAIMAINRALTPKQGADSDAAKVTLRVTEGVRWLNAGVCRTGGSALFAEFDSAGDLWCIIVHSDSMLTGIEGIYLDEIAVAVDGGGNVVTGDFCLDNKRNPWKPGKTLVPYFAVWTQTYNASNPVPPALAALTAALPGKWTSEHKLVGTTYSVLRGRSLKQEDRYKVYKWRGPLGLGEPAVSIVGRYSRCYDPRDVTQDIANPSTWKFTRNPILIWAWFRTHPYGRRKAMTEINWSKVGEQATICDQAVAGLGGTSQPRYECGISIPENKDRGAAEMEILATCDGQLAFDDQGRAYVIAGYYVAPTVALTRNRDIIAMESVEATNGESETQGVIVRYIDPLAKYSVQPSAAWLNPNYYVPGQPATFLTVDILGCSNHNQAMRLAKAIGMRSQPLHKIAPTTGLRALKLRDQRIANLNYDNTFAGEYEIVTPIEVDESGMFCGFGAVPIDPDRWTLLTGEEKARPVIDDTNLTADPVSPNVTSVNYFGGRLGFLFDQPLRGDLYFDFQYAEPAADPVWLDARTSMDQGYAYSGVVGGVDTYLVRWRGRTLAGNVTDWSDVTEVSIASDGILTIDEKIRVLIPKAAELENLYDSIQPIAVALGISTTAIDTARSDWLAFLAAITPAWDDTSVESPVDRVGYSSAVLNYEAAIEQLRQAVGSGSDGVPGNSVAVVKIYKRAPAGTPPATPTTTGTFTFASNSITGLNNGWTIAVPAANGQPLWVSAASAISPNATDTIAAGEWATPVIEVQDGATGAPGSNAATIYLFQRTNTPTPPAVPAATLTYTFATAALTGSLSGWSQSMPTTGGQYRWMITATALGTGASDTIATGEWAAPVLTADNGASVFTLVAGSNVNITPNSIEKISGSGAAWDASAYSLEGYAGDVMVSAQINDVTKTMMVGLNTDPTGGEDYTNLDYALEVIPNSGSPAILVYESGTNVASFVGVANDDTVAIRRRGTVIEYYRNGTKYAYETTGISATAKLYADTSLMAIGAKWKNMVFQPVGSDGAPGQNVATVRIFKRAPAGSPPATPTTTGTFTFASNTISGLNNGWTLAVPATDGNPLWVSAASAVSSGPTDTIAAGEWATPVIQVQDGAAGGAGTNVATVYLFQRTASATPPTVPGSTLTYNFSTGVLSGTLGSWSQSMPTSGGAYRWMITATALSTGSTDTITTGEWATPAIIAQDGTDGKTLSISGDRSQIHYDGTDALDPSTQTTTFTVSKLNIASSTITVSLYKADGTQINANSYLTAGAGYTAAGLSFTQTGATFTMLAAGFDGARGTTEGVKVRISADALVAEWPLVKVKDGASGTPGGTVFPSQSVGGTLNPGPITVNYTPEITLAAGASQNVSGHIATNSQLTAGGTITAQIQYSEAGSGTWNVAAASDGSSDWQYFSDGTRVGGSLSGSFTNSGSVPKTYNLRIVVSKVGGAVTLTQPESYFKAG